MDTLVESVLVKLGGCGCTEKVEMRLTQGGRGCLARALALCGFVVPVPAWPPGVPGRPGCEAEALSCGHLSPWCGTRGPGMAGMQGLPMRAHGPGFWRPSCSVSCRVSWCVWWVSGTCMSGCGGCLSTPGRPERQTLRGLTSVCVWALC